MFTVEELFTPEEIAARRDEKIASARQSVTDRLAAARQLVADLEAEEASFETATPTEEVAQG